MIKIYREKPSGMFNCVNVVKARDITEDNEIVSSKVKVYSRSTGATEWTLVDTLDTSFDNLGNTYGDGLICCMEPMNSISPFIRDSDKEYYLEHEATLEDGTVLKKLITEYEAVAPTNIKADYIDYINSVPSFPTTGSDKGMCFNPTIEDGHMVGTIKLIRDADSKTKTCRISCDELIYVIDEDAPFCICAKQFESDIIEFNDDGEAEYEYDIDLADFEGVYIGELQIVKLASFSLNMSVDGDALGNISFTGGTRDNRWGMCAVALTPTAEAQTAFEANLAALAN